MIENKDFAVVSSDSRYSFRVLDYLFKFKVVSPLVRAFRSLNSQKETRLVEEIYAYNKEKILLNGGLYFLAVSTNSIVN